MNLMSFNLFSELLADLQFLSEGIKTIYEQTWKYVEKFKTNVIFKFFKLATFSLKYIYSYLTCGSWLYNNINLSYIWCLLCLQSRNLSK